MNWSRLYDWLYYPDALPNRPILPIGGDGWYDFAVVALAAVFLGTRAIVKIKKSDYFDRLGVSDIASDLVFSITYGYILLMSMYPSVRNDVAYNWLVRHPVTLVLAWGLIEVLLASRRRVTQMAGGDKAGMDQSAIPPDLSADYRGPERRDGRPGRRHTDYRCLTTSAH